MNVSSILTMAYENKSNWTLGENKPNSNPNKAYKNSFGYCYQRRCVLTSDEPSLNLTKLQKYKYNGRIKEHQERILAL